MAAGYRFFVKGFSFIAMAAALAACGSSSSGKEKFAYVERPVEQLYASATRELERRRYDNAIAFFEEVERQHPYSSWARRSMLMKAFAYYQGNDYDEAVDAVDQFVALHPGNKDAAYAYYLKAMCHYERIRDVGRDQEFTDNAVAALTDVIRRYPDTEYAVDARLKLDLTYDHLAGKEMYIGRFYLRENKHIAAINRFKTVVDQYQTTSHAPEALHRLVEAYMELGIVGEARAAAALLGHNYPGSRWYRDSYRLFEDRDVLAVNVTRLPTAGPGDVQEEERDPNETLREIDPADLGDVVLPSAQELEDLAPDQEPEGRISRTP